MRHKGDNYSYISTRAPCHTMDGLDFGDEDDDYNAATAACAAIVLDGILRVHQERIQQWNSHHLYLCWHNLLPNPRHGTPWQQLWAGQDNRAFITTMGFDVATFRLILEGPRGFGARWEIGTIPRNDVHVAGEPWTGAHSLDGAGALGLVLHYLGSAMLKVSLQ